MQIFRLIWLKREKDGGNSKFRTIIGIEGRVVDGKTILKKIYKNPPWGNRIGMML